MNLTMIFYIQILNQSNHNFYIASNPTNENPKQEREITQTKQTFGSYSARSNEKKPNSGHYLSGTESKNLEDIFQTGGFSILDENIDLVKIIDDFENIDRFQGIKSSLNPTQALSNDQVNNSEIDENDYVGAIIDDLEKNGFFFGIDNTSSTVQSNGNTQNYSDENTCIKNIFDDLKRFDDFYERKKEFSRKQNYQPSISTHKIDEKDNPENFTDNFNNSHTFSETGNTSSIQKIPQTSQKDAINIRKKICSEKILDASTCSSSTFESENSTDTLKYYQNRKKMYDDPDENTKSSNQHDSLKYLHLGNPLFPINENFHANKTDSQTSQVLKLQKGLKRRAEENLDSITYEGIENYKGANSKELENSSYINDLQDQNVLDSFNFLAIFIPYYSEYFNDHFKDSKFEVINSVNVEKDDFNIEYNFLKIFWRFNDIKLLFNLINIRISKINDKNSFKYSEACDFKLYLNKEIDNAHKKLLEMHSLCVTSGNFEKNKENLKALGSSIFKSLDDISKKTYGFIKNIKSLEYGNPRKERNEMERNNGEVSNKNEAIWFGIIRVYRRIILRISDILNILKIITQNFQYVPAVRVSQLQDSDYLTNEYGISSELLQVKKFITPCISSKSEENFAKKNKLECKNLNIVLTNAIRLENGDLNRNIETPIPNIPKNKTECAFTYNKTNPINGKNQSPSLNLAHNSCFNREKNETFSNLKEENVNSSKENREINYNDSCLLFSNDQILWFLMNTFISEKSSKKYEKYSFSETLKNRFETYLKILQNEPLKPDYFFKNDYKSIYKIRNHEMNLYIQHEKLAIKEKTTEYILNIIKKMCYELNLHIEDCKLYIPELPLIKYFINNSIKPISQNKKMDDISKIRQLFALISATKAINILKLHLFLITKENKHCSEDIETKNSRRKVIKNLLFLARKEVIDLIRFLGRFIDAEIYIEMFSIKYEDTVLKELIYKKDPIFIDLMNQIMCNLLYECDRKYARMFTNFVKQNYSNDLNELVNINTSSGVKTITLKAIFEFEREDLFGDSEDILKFIRSKLSQFILCIYNNLSSKIK